ncbi:MAG: glycosyltransferase [Elusimicrobiota bacterium]
MTNLPMISVVTVVFNGKDFLQKTIESVISQTYPHIEYIVIDGGSTDGTVDIIKKYEDKITYWVSEKDNGIYDAMNKAIKVSKGSWLIFMNAGDMFVDKNVLKKIFIEDKLHLNADVIYSDTIINGNYLYKCDIIKNNVIHQSVIYKKSLHDEVGYYLVKQGLMISDYIFFMMIKDKKWVKANYPISIYNTRGVSNNKLKKHIYQKTGVDLVFGNIGITNTVIKLFLFPLYRTFKKIILGR